MSYTGHVHESKSLVFKGPLPPGNAAVVLKTTSTITVSWQAPAVSVQRYEVEWTVNGMTRSADITDTQYKVAGLNGGEEYIISIYTKNDAGERSATSASVSATTCK